MRKESGLTVFVAVIFSTYYASVPEVSAYNLETGVSNN